MKRYRLWLWIAVVLLFLNALIHSVTLFIQPGPQNETERELLNLMSTYKMDLGGGFKRSTRELFTALSACYSLLCLLGGLTLTYLAKQELPPRILKGVVGLHVLVFAIAFGLMLVFTFLPPIVLTGLVFVTLLMTYLLLNRTERPERST